VECEEIAKSQKVFPEVVRPFFKELEFSADDRLLRWWLLGRQWGVVLDPNRWPTPIPFDEIAIP
jgi:hypothetical protein